MRHLDIHLVTQVLAGQLPPAVLVQVIYEHVKELCPQCAETLELLQGEDLGESLAARPGDDVVGLPVMTGGLEPRYAQAFEHAAGCAVQQVREVEEERRRARRDFAELLRLTPQEREEKVVNARTRFRSRALAELLLEEAREVTRNDPPEALSLARLAVTVLTWTPGALGHDWAEILQARSLALRANARRVAGELRRADELFLELRRYLGRNALGDYELHGEVCSLEASLRIDQWRLEEAEELLDRAILFYRHARASSGVATALVMRASVQMESGDDEGADASLVEALQLLSPEDDRHLYLCAVSNRALALCNLERCQEARRLVTANASLYRRSDDTWTRLRYLWLEGIIARGLGELEEAETALEKARDGFLAEDQGFNAALVCLDLAMVYLEFGRTAELRQLARAITPVFESQDLHQEPMAAVLLFQKAVAADQVTADAIVRLRTYLERTSKNPRRRHERPS